MPNVGIEPRALTLLVASGLLTRGKARLRSDRQTPSQVPGASNLDAMAGVITGRESHSTGTESLSLGVIPCHNGGSVNVTGEEDHADSGGGQSGNGRSAHRPRGAALRRAHRRLSRHAATSVPRSHLAASRRA